MENVQLDNQGNGARPLHGWMQAALCLIPKSLLIFVLPSHFLQRPRSVIKSLISCLDMVINTIRSSADAEG